MKFDNNQANRRAFIILLVVTLSIISSSLLLLGAIKGMNAVAQEQAATLNEVNAQLKTQTNGEK